MHSYHFYKSTFSSIYLFFWRKNCTPLAHIRGLSFLPLALSQQNSAWADQGINHKAFKIYPVTSSHSDRKFFYFFYQPCLSLVICRVIWHADKSSQSWFDSFIVIVIEIEKSDRHIPQVSGSYHPIRFHACLHSYQPSTRLPVNTYLLQPIREGHRRLPGNQQGSSDIKHTLEYKHKHFNHNNFLFWWIT